MSLRRLAYISKILYDKYMKKLYQYAVISLILFSLFFVPTTQAANPTLSISNTNSSQSQITVTGDANMAVMLYYQTNYGTQSYFLGTTDSQGHLSTTFLNGNYAITPGSSAHVIVNFQQSSDVQWSYTNSGNGTFSLSQSTLTLNIGQTMTVTTYNSASTIYVSSNSNSNVVSTSVNGNQIQITGNNYGTTILTICSNAYGSQCSTLTVTVQNGSYYNGGNYNYNYNYNNNYTYGSTISLSQNSVSIGIGQSATITISGGSEPYLMYPSVPNLFLSVIGHTTLTLIGQSYGSGILDICSYGRTGCSTIQVTVGSGNYNYNSDAQYGSNWTYCAGENQQCTFYGTQRVRYGANGSYYYNTFTNGVSCTNAVFGDPAYGTYKQCSYGGY